MKLHEITDGSERRGQQVLRFNDYIGRLAEISASKAADFKKIGIELFKAGFSYDDTEFYLLPEEGGVYQLNFPPISHTLKVERGHLSARYYHFVERQKHEYARSFSTTEVLRHTVPGFLKFIKEAARKPTIAEGLGADALRFADYLATALSTDKAKKDMSRLAAALFKRGFELPEFGNVRINKDEDDMAGFGFSFVFPDHHNVHQRTGILTAIYTVFKENSKGETAMHRWTGHYSATEILEMGLDRFMDHARASARPVR